MKRNTSKSSVFKPNSVWSIIVDCTHVTYNKSVTVIFRPSIYSPSAAWSIFAIHRSLCSSLKKRQYQDALCTSVISRLSQPVYWNFPNMQIFIFIRSNLRSSQEQPYLNYNKSRTIEPVSHYSFWLQYLTYLTYISIARESWYKFRFRKVFLANSDS